MSNEGMLVISVGYNPYKVRESGGDPKWNWKGDNKWECYDFGSVNSFSDTLSKSVSTTPIVTKPTDNALAIESGSAMRYEVTFTRQNPDEPLSEVDTNDSTRWSNAVWVRMTSSLCNRWQADTDGYTMMFNCPEIRTDGDTNPNYPSLVSNVYISSLSFSYEAGYTDIIKGRLSMVVGGISMMEKVFEEFKDI